MVYALVIENKSDTERAQFDDLIYDQAVTTEDHMVRDQMRVMGMLAGR